MIELGGGLRREEGWGGRRATREMVLRRKDIMKG